MIKLTDLLNEESFTAVNKATGKVSVFKSKDSRDAAVKAGTHDEKEEAEKGGDSAGEKEKPNMFSKDTGYDAPDTKSSDTPKVQPRKVGKKLEAKVDKISAKLGLDPKKLGKEEYEKRMLSLVHDVLEDANFHGENRAIFAHLMGNPKLAQEPDYSKAPEFGSPEYEKWKDENTIYGSGFKNMTSEFDGVNSAATSITGETGWNGQLSLDAILNKMRKDGSGELADKIQAAFDKTQNESKSTKLTDILSEVSDDFKLNKGVEGRYINHAIKLFTPNPKNSKTWKVLFKSTETFVDFEKDIKYDLEIYKRYLEDNYLHKKTPAEQKIIANHPKIKLI